MMKKFLFFCFISFLFFLLYQAYSQTHSYTHAHSYIHIQGPSIFTGVAPPVPQAIFIGVAPSCATRPFRLALIPHYFYIFHFITKHNISENKSRAFWQNTTDPGDHSLGSLVGREVVYSIIHWVALSTGGGTDSPLDSRIFIFYIPLIFY